MEPSLDTNQLSAIERMHNGCILVGETGSGKSRTAIGYYKRKLKGCDIYVITTAKKRDDKDWDDEFKPFGITNFHVDSWNNIKKYVDVRDSFFIFDEQRLVGCGTWVKTFYKIAKRNQWILLTATPGDVWSDYIPVFVANGFYRNKSEFSYEHITYKPYLKYPVIDHDKYRNVGELYRHKKEILIFLEVNKKTEKIKHEIKVGYDKELYKKVFKERWDPYNDEPINEPGKLCYLLRKVVNSDKSRIDAVTQLLVDNPKAIIFYNFTYELNILREIAQGLGHEVGEWNGEKHLKVPTSDRWVYLAQYTAASEGWNCITTNVTIFYSQSYSYKTTVQAAGRIDRRNTPFSDLHYYYIRSAAPIDLAIHRSLSRKRDFNERSYLNRI